MDTDKITLSDLSIFHHDEEFSLFSRLDFTRTTGGRDKMKEFFRKSLPDVQQISEVQNILRLIIAKKDRWPMGISNGSIMMIYKFYETAIDQPPAHPSFTAAYMYKVLHGPDFSLIKYSVGHAFTFLRGMHDLMTELQTEALPAPLESLLGRASRIMNQTELEIIIGKKHAGELTLSETLRFANFIRYHYKLSFYELMDLYATLDAWYGMAMATEEMNLSFPEFSVSEMPLLTIEDLYHPLIRNPVSYDVHLGKEHNFLFLTGANMAGKSTFIRAVGSAVFLAHLGMGVPARSMQLSLFDGLLSNINVQDNVAMGESYFYNEVQRIKNTILRINDGKRWLILIDELFKGTNVEDAMKCSTVVIKGLIKIKRSLFILSTHLYEISDHLRGHPNIDFKFFETRFADNQLEFPYKLKDGVSNERLGYFILKNEKVVELLDSL